MATKYILEVEDKPFELVSEDGFTSEKLYRVKGFNSFVFDWNGLQKLTPYTESDLDAIRQEAFEKGYNTAVAEQECAVREAAEKGYQNGLNDAWGAARKIADIPHSEEEKVFGSGGWMFVVNHTASEAIEKIRQYEQEKEEQIQVGDEVKGLRTLHGYNGTLGIITRLEEDSQGFNVMWNNGNTGYYNRTHVVKTGRHFPEIAEVLQKMKEGENE